MLSDARRREALERAQEVSTVLTGSLTVAETRYHAIMEQAAIAYAYEVPALLAENAALRERLAGEHAAWQQQQEWIAELMDEQTRYVSKNAHLTTQNARLEQREQQARAIIAAFTVDYEAWKSSDPDDNSPDPAYLDQARAWLAAAQEARRPRHRTVAQRVQQLLDESGDPAAMRAQLNAWANEDDEEAPTEQEASDGVDTHSA